MAKRTTGKTGTREKANWAVYRLGGTPAALVGIVEAPDALSRSGKRRAGPIA